MQNENLGYDARPDRRPFKHTAADLSRLNSGPGGKTQKKLKA
jgi:hypothetical protein